MDQFEQLKAKYQPVLDLIKRKNVVLANLHLENGKLFMKGNAPSQEIKNDVWNAIKKVDSTYADLTCDIGIDSTIPLPAPRTYTVVAGDSLWKIADKHYGKGSLYPKIIEANPGKLKDDKSVIHPGDVLVVPEL